MQNNNSLTFHTLNFAAKDQPKSLVFFIHGYGANGHDLLSLAGEFKHTIKDAVYIAPNAPHINPFFPESYYWFPLENFTPEYLETEVNKAVPVLEEFIKSQQEKYNIGNENTYLIGFSQGSMLSLHTGLKQQESFKLIISFSGGCLPNPQNNYVNNQTPVVLTHGKQDDVLPWERTENAANFLKSHNINTEVKYLENDKHTISREALQFVKNIIANT